jgi:anti-sigma B factor antagonist
MKIELRKAGPIPVVVPDGRVTIGAASLALKAAIETELQQGAPNLIVDGSRVEYLDSSGLGELISAARTLSERGGRLGVCAPTPKFMEILEITGLHVVFLIGDTEEAVASALMPSTR